MAVAIREAGPADLEAVLATEWSAFERDDIVELTRDMLADPTAEPLLSLIAFVDDRPVGHVLFTAARVEGDSQSPRTAILAPLAVIPESQGDGIGTALVEAGLDRLRAAGTELVFVLGHPGYYPRFGFRPAGALGLDAPYPIPAKDADAWMVLDLAGGSLGRVRGVVICCNALSKPEHWRE